jgi:hypothetical protein
MPETPTERLIDQRVRNRAIDALEVLARGDEGVRTAGPVEYVEMFFDIVDNRSPSWREVSAYTEAEISELQAVHDILVEACDATAPAGNGEEFIAAGWPERIEPIAAAALTLMLGRGRFSEEHEEESPSD